MSKTNYGEIFRVLRKDKHISLEEVAGKQLSKSFVSKFERGASEISFKNLLYVLDQINVTLDEFMLHVNENQDAVDISSIRFFLDKMAAATNFATGDVQVKRLQALLAEYQQLATIQYNLRNYFFTLIIKAQLALYDDSQNMEKRYLNGVQLPEIKIIQDYLYSVENWGRFELFLFQMILARIDVGSLRQLARMAIKRSDFYAKLPELHFYSYGLLQSLFTIFLIEYSPAGAKEMLAIFASKLSEQATSEERSMYHATLKFYQGIYDMMFGEYATGLEIAQRYSNLMHLETEEKELTDIDHMLAEAIKNHAKDPADWEFSVVLVFAFV